MLLLFSLLWGAMHWQQRLLATGDAWCNIYSIIQDLSYLWCLRGDSDRLLPGKSWGRRRGQRKKRESERERSSGQLVEESGKMHGSSARQRHTGPDEGRSGRRVSGTNNRRSRRSRDTTPSSRNHRSRSKLKRDIYYRYTTAVCDRLSECAIMRWPILQTARRLPRTLPSAGRISGWMLLGSSWRLRISRLWGERVNHDVVTAFVDGCIFVFISA